MRDLIIVDDLTDGGALGVSRFGECVAVAEGEVEIRLLEGQTHRGQKGTGTERGRCNRRSLPPEVVGMVIGVEATAVTLQALQIETAMSLLVDERGEPGSAQGLREIWPAQQRPGEILDGHQFVVGKACQTTDALGRLAQASGSRQAIAPAGHAQPRVSVGAIEENRRSRVVGERLVCPSAGGRELRFEIPPRKDPQAEFADALRWFAGSSRRRAGLTGHRPPSVLHRWGRIGSQVERVSF